MSMLNFSSDYNNGMHSKILEALKDTNTTLQSGYGDDEYSLKAKELIKKEIGDESANIYFLVGGTQTNSIVIDALLKDYEGVIAPSTGHIALHEAGAIERLGHEVLEVPSLEGKIIINELEKYLVKANEDENKEHMVYPGVIYLSYPTEQGTLYTKEELKKIYQIAHHHHMRVFIDGARLGYGLTSKECDLTIKDIYNLSDAFYIGGTKVGAICGEAVVFKKEVTPAHFVNFIKKRGALLAKGRLLGVQFLTLFTDNLYYEISQSAINKAERLKSILKNKGFNLIATPTNQQFVVVTKDEEKALASKVIFSYWSKVDDNHDLIRFCTSWSTSDEDLDSLEKVL